MLPQAQRIGNDWVISFNRPTGTTGISYGAEWSATMQPGTWNPMSDSDPTPTGYTFSMPMNGNPHLFLRLKVTSP